ncbi:hypothetical protein G6O69_27745 [Pseudenhygromyxa sp. WMMC2535]|uniref:hypothetical protein n=1 Tax=Pseudenhygromyxa sp. WMMC2535 TaxID=2712867 RepID=UPI001554B04B|nr:hypothetical protein [Pseudenhygromyxa sp. WMMC2535]NVB41663.1 hypothetical protein [Pseudenhygromyxa sp. WMMC2535]
MPAARHTAKRGPLHGRDILRGVPLAARLSALASSSALAACVVASPELSDPQPPASSQGASVELEPTPPPPPSPVYDAAELAEHISDVYLYPPTACRLEQLLGEDGFAALEQKGGLYPNDLDEGSEGLSYVGRACPQPYCESALTWVHPEGGLLVVFVDAASSITIITNDPSLRRDPPLSVQRFLEASIEERGFEHVDAPLFSSPEHARVDPSSCRGPEIEARRQRYLATRAMRACDPEFSSFWQPAAVSPGGGAALHFYAEAELDTPRDETLSPGALVVTGWPHADDPSFVCAEYVDLAGARVVGWLRAADLVELPHVGGAPQRAQLDAFVTGSTPAWLQPGAPAIDLGPLSVVRRGGDRVDVGLEREIAGHTCSMSGGLELVGPRVLAELDTGCGAAGVVFDNAIYLWEDGSCSGARATCTGAYRPTPQ